MSGVEELKDFLDVSVQVEVVLDQRIVTLRHLLELDAGSVLKLTRSAGENIDILVGGALIGSGEIVVIEEMMGVRITDFSGED